MNLEDEFTSNVVNVWNKTRQLHLGIAQKDNKSFFQVLQEYFGAFRILSFSSGWEHSGWQIANNWTIKEAFVVDAKENIFRLDERFGLPFLAPSTSYTIESKNDKRIFTNSRSDTAVPWHCSSAYRPWEVNQGICVSRRMLDAFHFPIKVFTETSSIAGEMLVAELEAGNLESSSTVFLNAHTCHPGQFQDAFIGIVTVCQVLDYLRKDSRNFKFRYVGVLAPEHVGTVFYLERLRVSNFDFSTKQHIAMYCEMTALDNPISLQESFTGMSILDKLLRYLLMFKNEFRIGSFRSIVGNDETVWESVGFEVPCVSLSRLKSVPYYDAYHTSEDTLEKADIKCASEVLNLIISAIEILELDYIPVFTKIGLLALSNPAYELYTPWPDPTIDEDFALMQTRKMARLQDILPRIMNGNLSVLEIAISAELEFATLDTYIQAWVSKGLVEMIPVDSLTFYSTEKGLGPSIISRAIKSII
jgi:aminopeptidase-like protein